MVPTMVCDDMRR